MVTNYADLLASILRQGSLPSQQSGSFPNFDFQELLSPVPQVQSPVTQAFEKGFSISPALADFQERAKQREYNLEHRITGPDQPDEAPGLGVPDLEGTPANFAALGLTLAGAPFAPGLIGIGSFGRKVNNPNMEFAPSVMGETLADLLGWSPSRDIFDTVDRNEISDIDTGFDPNFDPNDLGALGWDVEDDEQGQGAGQGASEGSGAAAGSPGGPSSGSLGEEDVSPGEGPGGESGEGEGGSVICTELNRLGLLSDEIYQGDDKFGKTLGVNTMSGYHKWGIPAVQLMKRSKRAVWWATKLGVPCAMEMAYRAGSIEKGSLLGKALLFFGLPVCWLIGRMQILPTCYPYQKHTQ